MGSLGYSIFCTERVNNGDKRAGKNLGETEVEEKRRPGFTCILCILLRGFPPSNFISQLLYTNITKLSITCCFQGRGGRRGVVSFSRNKPHLSITAWCVFTYCRCIDWLTRGGGCVRTTTLSPLPRLIYWKRNFSKRKKIPRPFFSISLFFSTNCLFSNNIYCHYALWTFFCRWALPSFIDFYVWGGRTDFFLEVSTRNRGESIKHSKVDGVIVCGGRKENWKWKFFLTFNRIFLICASVWVCMGNWIMIFLARFILSASSSLIAALERVLFILLNQRKKIYWIVWSTRERSGERGRRGEEGEGDGWR